MRKVEVRLHPSASERGRPATHMDDGESRVETAVHHVRACGRASGVTRQSRVSAGRALPPLLLPESAAVAGLLCKPDAPEGW